jgi:hypothetical protein
VSDDFVVGNKGLRVRAGYCRFIERLPDTFQWTEIGDALAVPVPSGMLGALDGKRPNTELERFVLEYEASEHDPKLRLALLVKPRDRQL